MISETVAADSVDLRGKKGGPEGMKKDDPLPCLVRIEEPSHLTSEKKGTGEASPGTQFPKGLKLGTPDSAGCGGIIIALRDSMRLSWPSPGVPDRGESRTFLFLGDP